MINHPFQVLGRSTPGLLGRRRILDQMERALSAKSPQHISVLGPSMSGKTVLLSHLANVYETGARGFIGAAYLDFRHDTPKDDIELRASIAKATKDALDRVGSPLAAQVDLNDPELTELLRLTFEDMGGADQRFLMIMDGFDYVLAVDGVSRRMWNELRSLGQTDSLVYVTGSRKSLEKLCRSEESRTSDFWMMFRSNPIMVSRFDAADWPFLLKTFEDSGVEFGDGARKELVNWSGGVPVLSIALLREIAERCEPGARLEKNDIDAIAESVVDSDVQLLSALFADCDVELKSDLESLARSPVKGISSSTIPTDRRNELFTRGYAEDSGSKIKPSCRCMEVFVRGRDSSVSDLKRLFGSVEGFRTHGRSLLELRVSQVAGGATDQALSDYLTGAVRELGESPETSIKMARSIAARVLALIWEKELPKNEVIPEEWISEWKMNKEPLRWLDVDKRLPRRQGAQVAVLRLATGTEKCRPVAKWATRNTCILLDALQSVGDFAQHREAYPAAEVTYMFAFTAALCAIELVDAWQNNCLSAE